MEPEVTDNNKSNSMHKDKAEGITIPDFKLHYKAAVGKTLSFWKANKHQQQKNRLVNQ